MPRTRHGSGTVSRGSHTGGALTDFRSPGGALIGNPVWGSNVTSDDGSLGIVTALEITPGSVGTGAIAPGAVGTTEIASGAVVGSIGANQITGVMIGTDTITAANIAANTITGSEIAADAITAYNIAADTITSSEIATGTITANEIMSGTITSNEISSSTITAIEVNAGAIAADSVTATDIFGTTITGLSFHAGGSGTTQINVYDSSSNLIGYWDTAGLHVYDGKFYLEGLQLRYAISNNVGFWDFEGRAIRGGDGVVTFAYAGAVTDYVMNYMTLNGALGVDSYNGRIYFRYSGSWHYSDQNAGFSIPNYETICPVCELPLLPGQDMIGRGDRYMQDGALHCLYIHLGCAGTPMNQAIVDEYDAISHHVDLDADPVAKDKYVKDLEKLIKKANDAKPKP
jgi:hypothetical protein